MLHQAFSTNNRSGDAPIFFRVLFAIVLTGVLSTGLTGCGASENAVPAADLKVKGKELSSRPTWTTSSVGDPPSVHSPVKPGDAPVAQPEASKRTTWAILLGATTGPGADRQAATLAALAKQSGSVESVFIERRDEGYAVLYGSYDDPGSAQAKSDLASARAIMIADARPFEGAIMAPPAVRGVAGSTPEYDLRNVRQFSGDKGVRFTFQVGIYLRTDLQKPTESEIAEFRKSAEEAVRALRGSGEQAFYYHGPEKSTITIGLFSDDKDVRIPALRKKYPLNMVNGQQTTNAKAVAGQRGQESFLVRLPN